MYRHFWASMAIFGLLISACGAQSTEPSISAEDIQMTSVAAAFTIVAETQVAIPTNTQIPPTETSTPTQPPTDTPVPSLTIDPGLVAPSATATSASNDACDQPLLSWQGPSTSIAIDYEYSPKSKDDSVVVWLWVMTDLGECGYLSDLSTGPVGQYSAGAFIDGKKDFKVFGGFRLSEGSWKLVVRNDTIVALGGCYPNC
ncbi:MAG TPA: hypothetical protein VLA72_04595 [Anaerolineales bacterium]|nr:hypothetical protein [Anaerolineales bacterium]